MNLEPTKPYHGSGGEPQISKLHLRFLIAKFTRILMLVGMIGIIYTVTVEQIIYANFRESFMDNPYLPIDKESMRYIMIIALIMFIFTGYYIITQITKQYKLISYIHYSYCKCDKCKWYNTMQNKKGVVL